MIHLETHGISRRGILALLGGGAALAALPARAQSDWRPPAPDRELTAPVRGGDIYVRVNGDLDGPRAPVLMIHGGPGGTHAGFLHALPMADERAVVMYDQLDCGNSDRPDDPANWTVERFVSEVDAVRAALDLRRLHVVGHSWGGTIAAEYAARQPAGLESLVLQGPLISTPTWIADAYRLRTRLPIAVQTELIRGEQANAFDSPAYQAATAAFYAEFNSRVRGPAWAGEYRRTLKTPFNARLYETMWGPNEFISNGTLRDYAGDDLLPLIMAPTLFLCGRYDTGTPEACADFATRMRNARVQVIEEASHAIQVEQPEAYVAALRTWLRSNDRG